MPARKIHRDDPVAAVAALVSETLNRHGIAAVLSGDAAVSIYSANEFQSHDLDFITSALKSELDKALRTIGFERGSSRHYTHPQTEFIVEFPSGPLMVGEAVVHRHSDLSTPYGVIRLLTPTDAVKDRLAAFFHWSDRQSLEQALAVCRHQQVDLEDLARWARREPAPAAERYKVFCNRLAEQG